MEKDKITPATPKVISPIKESGKGLIEKLLAEVDSMDPTLAVTMGELEPHEEVLGVVHDEYLRKLFVMAHYYHREEARQKTEMQYEPSKEEREKLNLVRQRADAKGEILMDMFWLGVREQLGIWGVGAISVRDGYKIIKLKSRGVEALLARMLNQDDD